MSQTGLGSLVGDFVVQEKSVSVGVASVQVLAPDPTRWAILFNTPAAGGVLRVSINSPATVNTGHIIPGTTGPLPLTFRDFGALVNLAWFCVASAPTQVLTVTEVLYRPSVPTVDFDDLLRELKSFQEHAVLSHPVLSQQLSELRRQLSSGRPIGAEK